MGSRLGSVDRRRPPRSPWLVLLVAAVLPGAGQLLNRQPERALAFAFFIVLLGYVTYQLTTPQHSFLGRYAGGIFVYCMALLDAYKWARVRTEVQRHAQSGQRDEREP